MGKEPIMNFVKSLDQRKQSIILGELRTKRVDLGANKRVSVPRKIIKRKRKAKKPNPE